MSAEFARLRVDSIHPHSLQAPQGFWRKAGLPSAYHLAAKSTTKDLGTSDHLAKGDGNKAFYPIFPFLKISYLIPLVII